VEQEKLIWVFFVPKVRSFETKNQNFALDSL
jgi:hypothetical protein